MAKPRANRAEPTNADRAAAAGAALAQYSHHRGDVLAEDGPDECALIDLLTDLQHWAAAEGVSFENALESAQMHFAAEQHEAEG